MGVQRAGGVGGALVLPGDVVVADDDGAVVVPRRTAPQIVAAAAEHEQWEVFSRQRIDSGAPAGATTTR